MTFNIFAATDTMTSSHCISFVAYFKMIKAYIAAINISIFSLSCPHNHPLKTKTCSKEKKCRNPAWLKNFPVD